MSGVLEEHTAYLSLPHRLNLYRAPVAKIVRPGDRVVDVGCGTAVLGLQALGADASHVDSIDSTVALEIGRQSLTRAQVGAKCNFIRTSSFRATLIDRVDVVICAHVGHFSFDYHRSKCWPMRVGAFSSRAAK